MAVLANITVADSDLEKFQPNISNYLFEYQDDFSDIITRIKEDLYGRIKSYEKQNYSGYSNAEIDEAMENIQDYSEEKFLYKIICCMTIAEIFRANRMYDDADAWDNKAKEIPLSYWIDEDEDSIADANEDQPLQPRVKFGR